jgi:hypothetical protein
MPTSMRKAESFIEAGGSTPTEKAQAKVDNGMTAFTLRLYQSKLDKLAALKDARKQARLVEENPSRETISVNSLILEAIDMLLKQEAKRAIRNGSKKDS